MNTERPVTERVALVGVGLIGGSVGLAARERAGAVSVIGYDIETAVLDVALAHGVIDAAATTIGDAVGDADLVVIACPVGVLPDVAAQVLAAAGADTVVTDVGSTKRQIVAAIDDPRFIGGHPVAGAETSGVEHARADLFDDATWFVTPTSNTTGTGLERLMRFISALGARPQALDAESHDRMLADISHLPHVLANVLIEQAAASAGSDGPSPVFGPSFRDATRVAGANTAIWKDIYLSNSDALVPEIDAVIERLKLVRDSLAAQDGDEVEAWNERARSRRQEMLERDLVGGEVCELHVSVPNKPGVLAEIALALGGAGVNIVDMALYPAADMRSGAVNLWVAGGDAADRTEQLITELGFPVARA